MPVTTQYSLCTVQSVLRREERREVVTMLLLSPSAIQYLPGLECGEESVQIRQAASLEDRQGLQVSRICVAIVFENGLI